VGRRAQIIVLTCRPKDYLRDGERPGAGEAVHDSGGVRAVDLARVIRRAGERALARGMRTRACLDVLARTRTLVGDTPVVPMTYSSLLEAYGWERFADDARSAGASSLIVADLPAGERTELRRVQLVAPTSTDERIAACAAGTDGWLYLVTLTGTTGARNEVSSALAGLASRARRLAPGLPLYAGFGISTPEQARAAAELTDGVVVGSAALDAAENGPRGEVLVALPK